MKRATLAGGTIASVLVLVALAVAYRTLRREVDSATATAPRLAPSTPAPSVERAAASPGFLYGRVATLDGVTYEGRLRWGGHQEAFWGDYFNGFKGENPWAGQVPPGRLPKERRAIELFGVEIALGERPVALGRPFMARFGDIARIAARGRDVAVTLKSGTLFHLDRLEASDLDDGVRVWDGRRGVTDLDSLRIREIELLPTASPSDVPSRLHGTVRTRQGDFTGFVQWARALCVGTDELAGETADGEVRLRFDTIRSIARRSLGRAFMPPRDLVSALVTLRDGREIGLARIHAVGNLGIYVDDRRYGRVLVSWDAFEQLDLDSRAPGDAGPAYGDFPPGSPLTGRVATRSGIRLAGRLVYDLDESESTETLDAPARGVDYTIPFGRVASIVLGGGEPRGGERVRVTLHDGEELQLDPSGDLGRGNAGLLIFVSGQERPEYVPWAEVERVDFDRPPAIYPPLDS